MARYAALDFCDGGEVLAESDDLNIVYEAILTRIADTDGECNVGILDNYTAPMPNHSFIAIEPYGEEEDED